VKKMLTAFGSTYVCEKLFQSWTFQKNKFCLRLTDEQLRVALQSYPSNFKAS
jgi:hypothetical protein